VGRRRQVESSSGSTQTKKCPLCAEEIRAEAVVCRYCGAKFQVSERGYCSTDHKVVEVTAAGKCPTCGGEVIDRSLESRLLEGPAGGAGSAAVSLPPPPPVQPVRGELREAIPAKGLLYAGNQFAVLAGILLACFWGLSHMGSNGTRPPLGGFAVMAEAPGGWYTAPHLFLIAAVALWITYGVGVRRVFPRESKARGRLGRQYEFSRQLKQETGARYLLRRSGLRPAGIVSSLIWVAVAATIIANIASRSGDPGVTISPGAYVSIAIAAVGLLGSLALIPGRAGQAVRVDDGGAIHA
jgi:predicted RNA-binding Zn-ribbon protein involved in translation (DUF1610 family)